MNDNAVEQLILIEWHVINTCTCTYFITLSSETTYTACDTLFVIFVPLHIIGRILNFLSGIGRHLMRNVEWFFGS
jgi:hypothetical protein